MANKIKTISINALERAVKDMDEQIRTVIEWRGVSVTIKKRLGLMEMMSFVESVVRSCFNGEDNRFTPEIMDFAIRCGVLETYANFTLPANIEKRYELVYGCDALPMIMEVIDMDQYRAMMQAIDEKVSHMAQANIQAVFRQVNELYASLHELEDKMADVMNNLDPEMLEKLMASFSNGGIDEEKLVRAYLNEKKDDTERAEAS